MPIALSNHRYFSLLMITLLALALSACGERERDVDKAAQEGIMLIGNGSEPKSIDPHLVTGVTENQIIQTMVEGLIAYHPDNDTVPYPGVAQSWESNDDFTVWTFKLRDNAKWSNGDPVVASDFVYSWERILSPALGAEYAEMLYVIDNAAGFHQGEISDFGAVGVKALDDYTLQVTLEGSTPYFLSMLKHYSFYPVNPKVVEEFGGMTNRQSGWSTVENFVGNGPFQITAWNTNDFLEVERNPYYWDADNVGLNGIRFLPIENLNTEHTAFQGGRLHVTYEVPADRIPRLRDANDPALRIDPYLGSYFYRVNVTREPFNDPRVREALSLAIDRNLIVERVSQGGQTPATGFVPGGISGYPTSDAIAFAPERAKQLLAEAGYPGGEGFPQAEILINTSENHRKIAEAIQAMWRDTLGVDIGIFNQEWKVYLDSQSSLNYDVSRAGWIADYVHPMTFLEIFTAGNGNNDTGWENAEYDRLIRAAQTASSEDERTALMAQAEAILLDELPVVPIYWYTRPRMIDPRVEGWNPKLLDSRPYKNLSIATN